MTVTTDFDEVLAALLEKDSDLKTQDIFTAMCRVGRVNAPCLLFDLYAEGRLNDDHVAALVAEAWSAAEYPDQMGHEAWRCLFDAAGFVNDSGERISRPTEPLRLYRGSVPERRTDWSWTTNRAIAERFANGIRGRRVGRVWTALVEPWRLLAHCTGRDEDEYVVDTDGLLIEPAP